MAINHYATLEIRPDATSDEIDAAALAAIANVRNNPMGSEMHLEAIREAMATLRDPVRRAAYDASLVVPPPGVRKVSPVSDFVSPSNQAKRMRLFIGAALVSGLVLGYFVGREHLKYQMQSAMTEALGEFTTKMGKAFGGVDKGKEAKPVEAKALSYPIKVTLIRKGWVEQNYGSKLTMDLSFKNGTGKPVRAFDGRVIFTDLLGNQILATKVAINEAVAAEQSLAWSGALDFNQFMQPHSEFRSAEQQNMKVSFELNKVLFEDGETKVF